MPECDSYITKYLACVSAKVPDASRAQLQASLDQTRAAWKQAAATPDGKASGRAEPYLHRWTIDLNAAAPRCTSVQLEQTESEFPQCDPRHMGKPYRHGWYASCDGRLKSPLSENENFYNVIGHFDHETRAVDRYSCGQALVSEPVFVPIAGGAEGEGYVLALATSFETQDPDL